MSQVSSAADLTASLRRTTGTRPPPLVGCSVTALGDSLYVFGGRLVPTRTMVQTLYRLDLRTLEWSLLSPPPASSSPTTTEGTGEGEEDGEGREEEGEQKKGREPPKARYFHSCCAWGTNRLVIFGGEGYNEPEETSSTSTESVLEGGGGGETSEGTSTPPAPALQTLDDLHIFNTDTKEWEQVGEIRLGDGVVERPRPRYAHLGVVCTAWDDEDDEDGENEEGGGKKGKEGRSRLMIMGGQDIKNTYLHSTDILDLDSMTWIQTGKWDRHIGTYRAIATTSLSTVKPGGPVSKSETLGGGEEELVSLSWTEKNRLKDPEPILLFSNFNFTQYDSLFSLLSSVRLTDDRIVVPRVRRDLDLLQSPLSSNPSSRLSPLSLSNSMTGHSLPPGLRFPSGFQLGHHLIIFGTFLSQHVNNFAIWSLDLGKRGAVGVGEQVKEGRGFEWMKVDPGNVLQRGSWNRAVGWGNNVVVLGDRERDIAADYDHRQTNFTHVAFIDLEAHGIYQPPLRSLPPIAQSFGLSNLSQPFLSDFEIVCSDGKRLACSRKVLEDRWSWFNSKVLEFRGRASGVVAAQTKRAQDASVENSEAGSFKSLTSPTLDITTTGSEKEIALSTTTHSIDSRETRLTPRTLNFPEPSPVVLAFLQYLYTLSLCTPLQLQLPILSSLLLLAKNYREDHLKGLVVHALHEQLEKDQGTAPGVYEAATLAGCTALQVRALKSLMSMNVPSMGTTRGGGLNGAGTRGGGQGREAEPMARQASQGKPLLFA
ncbi:uncharacterized protein JCM6883_005311 [Sporobolomyces salmoneus]|uniref:uncharacterized protein n=1 Tax=Sporobolomyces salmoneus TaxID=183962 RepID=UPI00316F11BB